jgi:hypothetical protein
MVQVCTHLWAMQQLFFWRAFRCSQDAQLLVHKHMPRAGFLYEYGRPAGAARARVNRDSRNELMELHATQKVCHRRATAGVPGSANSNRLKVRLRRFPAPTAEVISGHTGTPV